MNTNVTGGHLPTGRLFELVRSSAIDDESRSHLNGCELCQYTLSWMQILAEMGTAETSAPPKDLVEQALALARVGSSAKWSDRVVAFLTYDSLHELRPANVRRRGVESRHLIYSYEGIEIRMNLQPSSENRCTLVGQVAAKDTSTTRLEGIEVSLRGNGITRTSNADEWGEFLFDDLPEAQYVVDIRVDGQTIGLPAFSSSDD